MLKSQHLHMLCRTREDYRALWDAQAAGQSPPTAARGECVHLGRVLSRPRACCPRAWVRECTLLGIETTQAGACQGCEHFEEA